VDPQHRILVVEDSQADFMLLERHLTRAGLGATLHRVDTWEDLTRALESAAWDAVVSDLNVPGMDFAVTLRAIQERLPGAPIILLSGELGEERAVELLKAGVTDFVLKDSLARLVPAIERGLRDAVERRAREAAETALRESERSLREAQEAGRVGGYVYHIQENCWHGSSVLDAIFGTDPSYPHTVEGWRDLIHPLDRDAVFAHLGESIAGHRRFEREYRIVRRNDGAERWVLGLGQVEYGEHDVPQRLVGTIQDITERRQAEDALRLQSAALNAAANPMVITDRDGGIVWANPAFTALTGYAAGEAIGRNPRELVKSGKQDAAFYRLMWDTILAGNVWRGELTNRKKDGTEYLEEMTITPVRDAGGTITHFVALKQDITETRRLQEHLQQSQKMESIGRLAGGVAHDFNNLLTVINATAVLAAEHFADGDPARQDLRLIAQTGERAAALTQQLLAFSRRQILKPEVLNLGRQVLGLKPMLERLLGEDVEIVARSLEDQGNVRADAAQIQQVVLNLAVNARDAMPRGGTLAITTRDADLDAAAVANHPSLQAGRYVLLAITDTGVGMDENTRERIFEPFFTTKELGKGTGLGLATVYGIVKQSGGSIWVYSEPGKGTTFKIYLPRVDAPVNGHRRPATLLRKGTETVLLVEDEDAVRSVATRILRAAGYTVLAASRATEALEVLARQAGTVHLLITDVVLPGMSGPELALKVSETHPQLRVLFTSGYADDAILRHGLLHQQAHFVGKPYTVEELTAAVRSVLDGPWPA